MANIKSAKKRIRVNAKKQLRNKIVKSSTKTYIKKAVAASAAGEAESAESAFRKAISMIDKAKSKGVYHKNTASRKKAKLARMRNRAAV